MSPIFPSVHLGLFVCSQMFHLTANENILMYQIYVVSLWASKDANKKSSSKAFAVFQVRSYSGINLFQAYRSIDIWKFSYFESQTNICWYFWKGTRKACQKIGNLSKCYWKISLETCRVWFRSQITAQVKRELLDRKLYIQTWNRKERFKSREIQRWHFNTGRPTKMWNIYIYLQDLELKNKTASERADQKKAKQKYIKM